MALTHQPSLLDLADTAQLARPLTDATRTELAGGAWVDHLPAWVAGSDEVLERLRRRRAVAGRAAADVRPGRRRPAAACTPTARASRSPTRC